MPWEKGQSGNSRGRAVDKPWRDAIRKALARVDDDGKTLRLERLANALVDAGLSGDVPAIKEIGDRVEGKVAQAVIGGDDGDPPISVQVIELRAVQPASDEPRS